MLFLFLHVKFNFFTCLYLKNASKLIIMYWIKFSHLILLLSFVYCLLILINTEILRAINVIFIIQQAGIYCECDVSYKLFTARININLHYIFFK